MPVTAAQIVVPVGPVPADLLPVPPEEVGTYATREAYLASLVERADGWASRAAAAYPGVDAAQVAFVASEAFRARYLRAVADPASMGLAGEGNTQYLVSQINAWKDHADAWAAEAARLADVPTRPAHIDLTGSTTTSGRVGY